MAQAKDTEPTEEKQAPNLPRKPLRISDYEYWLYAFLSKNVGRRMMVTHNTKEAVCCFEAILLSLEVLPTGVSSELAPRATFHYVHHKGDVYSARLANITISPIPLSRGGER